jgi:hypothetical protein
MKHRPIRHAVGDELKYLATFREPAPGVFEDRVQVALNMSSVPHDETGTHTTRAVQHHVGGIDQSVRRLVGDFTVFDGSNSHLMTSMTLTAE